MKNMEIQRAEQHDPVCPYRTVQTENIVDGRCEADAMNKCGYRGNEKECPVWIEVMDAVGMTEVEYHSKYKEKLQPPGKHTPGSWGCTKPYSYGNQCWCIESETSNHGRVVIAETKYNADGNEESNARLIASAPQLLEVAKWLLEWWDNDKGPTQKQSFYSAMIEAARAAVKKTEGE